MVECIMPFILIYQYLCSSSSVVPQFTKFNYYQNVYGDLISSSKHLRLQCEDISKADNLASGAIMLSTLLVFLYSELRALSHQFHKNLPKLFFNCFISVKSHCTCCLNSRRIDALEKDDFDILMVLPIVLYCLSIRL